MVWVYFAILEVPWLLYCIIGEVTFPVTDIYYDYSKNICVSPVGWTIFGIIIISIYILMFLILAFLIRKIRDEYNEYKLIRIGVPISLGPLIAELIVYIIKLIDNDSVPIIIFGRALSTAAILIAVTVFFWGTLLIPVYHHMFHREKYLQDFLKTVKNSSEKYVREGVAKAKAKKEKELAKLNKSLHQDGEMELQDNNVVDIPDDTKLTKVTADGLVQVVQDNSRPEVQNSGVELQNNDTIKVLENSTVEVSNDTKVDPNVQVKLDSQEN